MEAPITHVEEFAATGLEVPPSGMLVCGPPGCGKTLLAKAVADEVGLNFVSISGSELFNSYVEWELIAEVFHCIEKTQSLRPCVLFIDDIDEICSKTIDEERNRSSQGYVKKLFTQMYIKSGLDGIFVMGGTTHPDMIDPAVFRNGDFDKGLYVGSMDDRQIAEIPRAAKTHYELLKLLKLQCAAARARVSYGYS